MLLPSLKDDTKIVLKLHSRLVKFQIVISIFFGTAIPALTQEQGAVTDSLINNADSIALIKTDSLLSDSLKVTKKNKKTPIESPVTYNASDSMIITIDDQKLFLYGDSKVNYEDVELKAYHIEFDMSDNVVSATGRADTTPEARGNPLFTQGSETFNSDTINYNFKTKKGLIKYINTEEGDGFLQAQRTKRLENGHIHIKNGKYTTCNAAHPHFYIGLTKAIAIPDDKIVSGPAYFVMEDIPLPLVLPFGFFPNTKNRSAGIILPTYSEEKARGLSLRQGGFYFPISDYMDLVVQGDFYFRGTWGLGVKTNYLKKYSFSGYFDGSIYVNNINDEINYQKSKAYSFVWTHRQDPKANPTRTFSANVNITSTTYSQYYSNNINQLIAGTTSNQLSSISYSKHWGSLFSLSTSMNYNQNNKNHTIGLDAPKASFNMSRVYPFRSKNMTGDPKWFENIQISYQAVLDNQINATDSTLFDPLTLRTMKNGFSHSVPISLANFRLLKIINITPSISYKGVMYSSRIEKRLPENLQFGKNLKDTVIVDTTFGFNYAHAINTGISISASPKIYGTFRSTRPTSYIQAIRHVITPSATFSYSPDMGKIMPNYYRKINYATAISSRLEEERYSVFANSLYPPPIEPGRSASLNLGLSNNLEMKVLSKNDTTGKPHKVSIFDNLNFNASYSPFSDSMRWSYISMNGATRLFNNKINITFNGTFDPYAIDIKGNRYNKSYFKETGKLARLTNFTVNIGMSFSSNAIGNKSGQSQQQQQNNTPRRDYSEDAEIYGDYVDFDIPWSLTVNYSWSYSKPLLTRTLRNNIRVSGDVSLTKKWKIGGNFSYDFVNKKIVYPNMNIARDLHCWQMRMNIVPFGPYQSYSFTIQAKSALLRDLKWDKKKRWFDYF